MVGVCANWPKVIINLEGILTVQTPVQVRIPAALRRLTENREAIELCGSTIGDIVSELSKLFPELGSHLRDESGKLRNFFNIYLNDEDIRYLKREASPVITGDIVLIVPAVAGG